MDEETTKSLPDLPWTEEHENILVDWADKAMCYRWLHSKSNQRFSKQNALYTIPVIIMSTLTGTANFAQDRFADEYRNMVPMVIGAVNIFAGILTTVQQFLKISELNEAHRVASISWDKFYRNIKVELAKHPRERTSASHMLKLSKEEFDRLMETSPVISDQVVELFKKTFSDMSDPCSTRAKAFEELKKPEICDSLESTRNIVYRPRATDTTPRWPMSRTAEPTSRIACQRNDTTVVDNFVASFKNEFAREPTADEIRENLQDQVSIEILNTVNEGVCGTSISGKTLERQPPGDHNV